MSKKIVKQEDPMRVKQNNKCLICSVSPVGKGDKDTFISFDPVTEAVRGLICAECAEIEGVKYAFYRNLVAETVIDPFLTGKTWRDKPDNLRWALKYIEKNRLD
jgi:hypothetical protein